MPDLRQTMALSKRVSPLRPATTSERIKAGLIGIAAFLWMKAV